MDYLSSADVEAEFHPRLFPMEGMRQPDEDGAVAGHAAQQSCRRGEEGEHVARLRSLGPQAKLIDVPAAGRRGGEPPAVAPTAKAISSAASEPVRLGRYVYRHGRPA